MDSFHDFLNQDGELDCKYNLNRNRSLVKTGAMQCANASAHSWTTGVPSSTKKDPKQLATTKQASNWHKANSLADTM